MPKFDVWIPNIVVEADNHQHALEVAGERLKDWIVEYVNEYGEAEEVDGDEE